MDTSRTTPPPPARLQRKCDSYWQAQQAQRWAKDIENFRNIDNGELRVGVMGLGVMGGAVVDVLCQLGYPVAAWTRTARERAGVTCFHGREGLAAFAAVSDVLVCLLPLTGETRGILNAELFASMPRGASVINAARGGHLVEGDLLAALETGQVGSGVRACACACVSVSVREREEEREREGEREREREREGEGRPRCGVGVGGDGGHARSCWLLFTEG